MALMLSDQCFKEKLSFVYSKILINIIILVWNGFEPTDALAG